MDDVAKFLSGSDRENALHIRIEYSKNAKRTKHTAVELRKKMVSLKKDILYEKTVEDKVSEISLNSPRTFSYTDDLSTYCSLGLILYIRPLKIHLKLILIKLYTNFSFWSSTFKLQNRKIASKILFCDIFFDNIYEFMT